MRQTDGVSSFVLNVTFDCEDPHALAAFWAGVTGYTVDEQRDGFVRLTSPDRRGVRHLLFFAVPEPRTSKNRMHVDLATKDPAREIPRLLALGARLADETDAAGAPSWRGERGIRWVVLQDPEGNEFYLG